MVMPASVAAVGSAALLLGCALRYLAARARFYRRNAFGVMEFQQFHDAFGFVVLNRAASGIGRLLMIAGTAAVLIAVFSTPR